MKIKLCCRCKLEKSLEEFGCNKNNDDRLQKYCRECGKIANKKCYRTNAIRRQKISEHRDQSRVRNRLFALEYLMEHPCVDCGETDPMFLEFDHVREKKKNNVSNMIHTGWAIESIEEEIAKCEVRCVKCHRVRTAKQFGWYNCYLRLVARHNSRKVGT